MQELTCYGCNAPLRGDYESKMKGDKSPGYYKLWWSHSKDKPNEFWTYEYCKPCYANINSYLIQLREHHKKGAKQ